MRKILFVLTVTLVSVSLSTQAQKYSSKEFSFAVNFPGKPTVTSQDVPTVLGDILVTMFMFQEGRGGVYVVGVADYPDSLRDKSIHRAILTGAKSGVIENINGKTKKEKFSMFQGHHALDFIAKGDGYHLAYKLIMVHNRLFQVGIMKVRRKVSRGEISRFIDTFQLI